MELFSILKRGIKRGITYNSYLTKCNTDSNNKYLFFFFFLQMVLLHITTISEQSYGKL